MNWIFRIVPVFIGLVALAILAWFGFLAYLAFSVGPQELARSAGAAVKAFQEGRQ